MNNEKERKCKYYYYCEDINFEEKYYYYPSVCVNIYKDDNNIMSPELDIIDTMFSTKPVITKKLYSYPKYKDGIYIFIESIYEGVNETVVDIDCKPADSFDDIYDKLYSAIVKYIGGFISRTSEKYGFDSPYHIQYDVLSTFVKGVVAFYKTEGFVIKF